MSDPRLERPYWRGRTNVDRLTIACIERAEEMGGHEFVVTQGSYQAGAGDKNSAGTHDLGGVVDLRWCGHDSCILALRKAGMAASWHRTSAQGPWPDHIHAVVRDHPNQADSAQRQTASVLAGRNGLSNNGPDDGPRLNPFPHPEWPWPKEDPMADYATQLDAIEQNTKALLDGQRKAQRQNAAIRSKVTKLVKKGSATRDDLAELADLLAAHDEEN